ncbi:MAG: protein kinase [Planctomycetes bacterium]|nr:protein kinase [Planctomycetota bacterium]
MTAPRGEQIKAIFSDALALAPEARDEFLDRRCGADVELRAQVESLLSIERQAPDAFMQLPAFRPEEHSGRGEAASVPRRVGRYQIVRKLGEGGMGIVYEARQENPARTVAVKLIRSILATPHVRRRFEKEAQLLGQLQHPGIATVYEAGTADVHFDGAGAAAQPFFAMEFVQGVPLHDYVARRKLGVRGILELFLQVCAAVRHAHERGVIHRDLKPPNILVDHNGLPKILDFGVARLTDADARATTLQTDVGQLVGTLQYMSPEQVHSAGADIDARADVYALGVILYQLLSRRMPLDLQGRSIPEAARMIQEVDPTRLGSIDRTLRGDLETIVEKAIEKSRDRRYGSAAALAADIRRFLGDEPIVARPATTWYQLRKFARRNRGLVAGTVLGTAALAVGLVVAVMQAYIAIGARNVAREEEQVSRYHAYLAGISAAASALVNDDVALARRSLDRAHQTLRGWEWRHLSAQLDQSLFTISTAGVGASPYPYFIRDEAGESVALTTDHGVLRWNLSDGARMDDLAPPGTVLATNRAGDIVATLASRTLAVQRLPHGGRQGYSLDELGAQPFGPVQRMEISRDGDLVVLAWPMRAMAIDLPARRLVNRKLDNRGISDLSVLDRAWMALSAAVQDRPAIWRVLSDELFPLAELGPPGACVDISPDGTWAVAGYLDGSIRAWELAGSRPNPRRTPVHASGVSDIAFNPKGTVIASASTDRSVSLWDAESMERMVKLRGHDDAVRGIAFSPDGSRLVSAADDETLRVWDGRLTADPGVLKGHTSFVYPVAFSHEGSLIASAGWDRTIRLWDALTYREVAVLDRGDTASYDFVISLAFSGDDSRLLSLEVGALRVWDLATGHEIARLDEGHEYAWRSLGSGGRNFLRAGFLPDGIRVPLLWAAHGSTVPVWDASTGQVTPLALAALEGLDPLLQSSDDRFLLGIDSRAGNAESGATDGRVARPAVLRSDGGEVLLPPLSGSAIFTPGASHPRLAARLASDVSVVGMMNLENGAEEGRFVGHAGTVFAIACAPDGTRLATGGSDQTVRIWDAQTFTEIVQLRGHTSYVWSLAFSPDGSLLASGSGDGTVRVWDIRPFREVLQARTEHDAMAARLLPRIQGQLRTNAPAVVLRQFVSDRSPDRRERQVVRQLVLQASLAATDPEAR